MRSLMHQRISNSRYRLLIIYLLVVRHAYILRDSEGEHNHSFKKDKCCLSACLASP